MSGSRFSRRAWSALVGLIVIFGAGPLSSQRDPSLDRSGGTDPVRDRLRLAVSALAADVPPEVEQSSLTTIYLLGVLETRNRREIEIAILHLNVLQAVQRCATRCHAQVRRLARDVLEQLKAKLRWRDDAEIATQTPTFDENNGEARLPLSSRVTWLTLPEADYEISSPECNLDWALVDGLVVTASGSVARSKREYFGFDAGQRLRLERTDPCLSPSPAVELMLHPRPLETVDRTRIEPLAVSLENRSEVSYRLAFPPREEFSFDFDFEVEGWNVYEMGTRQLRGGADTVLELGRGEDEMRLAIDDDGRRALEDLSSQILLRTSGSPRSYSLRVRQINADSEAPVAEVYFRRWPGDSWPARGTNSPLFVDLAASPFIDLRNPTVGAEGEQRRYRSTMAAQGVANVDLYCAQNQWVELKVTNRPVRLGVRAEGARFVDFEQFRAICTSDQTIEVELKNLGRAGPLELVITSRLPREDDLLPRRLEARQALELDTPYRLVFDGDPESSRSTESDAEARQNFPLPCDGGEALWISLSKVSPWLELTARLQTRRTSWQPPVEFEHVQETESGRAFWLPCDGGTEHFLAIEHELETSGAANLLVRDVSSEMAARLVGSRIEPGEVLRGTLLGRTQEQWATFECDQDLKRYAVETFELVNVDTRIELLSGTFRTISIDADDDGGDEEFASRVEWTCERKNYSFKVTGYDEDESLGTFKLKLLELE